MSILAGRYELERRLGGGGMAEVFLARLVGKDGFSRRVAIKRVLAHLATDEAFAKMFVAEAQMCAALQHPNIVSVLDFDRDDDGRPFLVIELVDGPSLAELAEGGPLPVAAAVHLATELLRGLAYAHDLPGAQGVRGIVHRDISPHNVLLSWEGAVKLSDFGIAKARDASGVTASELLKGKPAYMSPEQANGESLDGRSDLFAVGVVLWELLVGRALFAGHTTQETLARVLFAPIPSPRSIRSELPEDVDAVVMKLLARERTARYADASDAIAALIACKDSPRDGREKLVALLADRFAADAPQRGRMLADVPTVRTPLESAPTLPAPRDAAPSRRRPVTLALAGLAIASTTVAVTLVATRRDERAATSAPPPQLDAGAVIADRADTAAPLDAREPGAPVEPDAATLVAVVDSAPAPALDARAGDAAPTDANPGARRPTKPPGPDFVAERAKFWEAMNAQGGVTIPPPDETSVEPLEYFAIVNAEIKRLFGSIGEVTYFSVLGLRADGRFDQTARGSGMTIVYAFRPITEDGYVCAELTSLHAGSGRLKLVLSKSEQYCRSLDWKAGIPKCNGSELRARATEHGISSSELVDADLRRGVWKLWPQSWKSTTTPNDCH